MKSKGHCAPSIKRASTRKKASEQTPRWILDICITVGLVIETWMQLKKRSRRGPSTKYPVILTSSERLALLCTVRRSTATVQSVERAKIILLAATGLGIQAIADVVKVSRETARRWCKRFLMNGLEGLKDNPRSGAPRTIPRFIEVAIILYIVSEKALNRIVRKLKADGYDDDDLPLSQLGEKLPQSRLSIRDIHYMLVRDFGDDAPCITTVAVILKRLVLRPWLYQSWIHIRDPDFWEKAAVVIDLNNGIYDGEPLTEEDQVLSSDELTQLQVLWRIVTDGRPDYGKYVDFEYHRDGVLKMHAARNLRSGIVHHRFVEDSNMTEFRVFVKEVMALEPYASAQRVFWIVDNGSCHHPSTFGKWLKQEFSGRAIAVHTPAHGSWLNQIEIFFSTLVRKALTPRNFPSREAMMKRIDEFIEHENSKAKPYNWTYTKEQLRELLDRLEEEGLFPLSSGPLDIEGIGPKKREALLDAFGDEEGVRASTIEELMSLPGFGQKLSERVYRHLHEVQE